MDLCNFGRWHDEEHLQVVSWRALLEASIILPFYKIILNLGKQFRKRMNLLKIFLYFYSSGGYFVQLMRARRFR